MTPDTLRRCYVEEQRSIRALAALFGQSYRQVRAGLVAAGVPLRRRGPNRDTPRSMLPQKEVAELRRDIAALGVTAAAAKHRIARERLHAVLADRPLPRGQKRRVDDRQVRLAYTTRLVAGDGATAVVADLAQHYGVAASTVRRSLKRSSVMPD